VGPAVDRPRGRELRRRPAQGQPVHPLGRGCCARGTCPR
jgi:hypothetical protein